MSKRAFFVIGPEGSGTYMLAEAFVAAGCTYCDRDNVKEYLKEQRPTLLVLRRSLPHAGRWANIDAIMSFLEKRRYDVSLIGIIRDEKCAKSSVLNRREKVPDNLYAFAVQFLGQYLLKYPGRLISYEYFVTNINYRQKFFNDLGLVSPREMEFYDANAKYFV